MSDYKVKDINLAEFGRKEISLAETEMPGLMALRKEYKGKKPLKDAKILGSTMLVIGRSITEYPNPLEVLKKIQLQLT